MKSNHLRLSRCMIHEIALIPTISIKVPWSSYFLNFSYTYFYAPVSDNELIGTLSIQVVEVSSP